MTLRRIQVLVVAMVLSTLFLASGVAQERCAGSQMDVRGLLDAVLCRYLPRCLPR